MAQKNDESSEALLREIEEQSQKEAESILEQAEKDARAVLERADTEAKTIRSEILQKSRVQAEGIRKRILSGVHLEIKKQGLQNREQIVVGLLKKVEEKLHSLRETEAYGDILRFWIEEGIHALPDMNLRIIPGALEKKWITPEFLAQIVKESGLDKPVSLKVSPETFPEGGAIIESEDGRMRFDNRFPARMQRKREAMRQFIKKQLGG